MHLLRGQRRGPWGEALCLTTRHVFFFSCTREVSGAGATIAALRDVEKVKDLEDKRDRGFSSNGNINLGCGHSAN